MTVVGAGPAGLACAIVLARAGRSVVVREWHETIGSRFHGDYQGLENWSDAQDVLDELHEAGIETNFDAQPIYKGTAFDSHGKEYPVQAERAMYYLIQRGGCERTLDSGLLAQAIAAGVKVRFGDRVSEPTSPAVLSIGPRTADVIANGYLFETDGPDGNWVAVDDRLAPLGYAYLLVHGGRGTVASCMFTGFKHHSEHVARTIAFFTERVGLEMRRPQPFGGFGNFRLPRTAIQGGHPVIGEQAGFQDALAGFGMRYALRSGILAAQSLLTGTDYELLWRRDLMPLLKSGISNRFIFNSLGERGRRWVLGRLSQSDTTMVLNKLYRPSLLNRLVFPIARWQYRKPLRDPSCDHIDCNCVWCRHGAESSS